MSRSKVKVKVTRDKNGVFLSGGLRMALGTKVGVASAALCYMGIQLPLQKGAQPPILAHVYCGQTVAYISYTAGHL